MLPARRIHRYTYADYVAVERDSAATKHEFLDGEIYAMSRGTEEHSALSLQVLAALDAATRDGPCRAHTSDLRIYVEAVGLATFPDGSVICGALEQHPPSPKSTALNPTVLVEVTSDSSEEYDTGEKAGFYRTIPSLRDYVIVSHRERRITVHSRAADGAWTTRVAISSGRVPVNGLQTELVVDDIYRKSTILSLVPQPPGRSVRTTPGRGRLHSSRTVIDFPKYDGASRCRPGRRRGCSGRGRSRRSKGRRPASGTDRDGAPTAW